ncbi:MAG TPA: molybdate ABC transporter substrate-binding protein [Vicinamibacterales bacterium]|jgi:molybdate transport system substrate-binding protein
MPAHHHPLRRVALAGALAVCGFAHPRAADVTLTVSAAVSLKEAIEEVGRRFEAGRPGVRVQYNFGASGELQQQIEAGAPIDLFVSASETNMDALHAKRLIVAATRRTIARNVLVVAVPSDSPIRLASVSDLQKPQVRRIAIGSPKTVPAGAYAEQCLRATGEWDRLQSRLVFGGNVRQVLDYLARGEVDAGFVYATDVAVRGGVAKAAFRPPQATYAPITYPAAVVGGSPHLAEATAFVEMLAGREGQAVLARFGFEPAASIVR